MQLNEVLNENIKKNNKVLFELLSEKGKKAYFPTKGILAQTAEAKGKDINATIGIALDENGEPIHLKSIYKFITGLKTSEVFPYAPSFGLPELRKEWQKKIYEKNPTLNGIEISLPVATNGLTHGLYVAGYLFVDNGDKIIIPDLYWGNYNLMFKNNFNAEFVTYPLFNKNKFNVEGLEEALDSVTSSKKIVLLNFPNNPTGYSATNEDVENILKILNKAAQKGNKIIVLIDDAYFGLFYEKEVYKESLFSKLASLHENILAIKIDGPTKEDYVWGFRVGFITFGIKNGNKELYDALEQKVAGTIRGNISNISKLSQELLLKAYRDENYVKEKEELAKILEERYLKVKEVLDKKEYENFKPLPFNSGYFMCVKPTKDIELEKLRKYLLDKYSTGIIVQSGVVRIAFSSVPLNKLETLFDNLESAINDLL